ncbi:exodeoxyribonuclease VII large subunit, partial [Achromobacter spanius]|uniref:exodeoxyribonuclease VII large subunit n=1 Tax=Achromobacter spanius TaxID=217203 RepID=UPI00320A4284
HARLLVQGRNRLAAATAQLRALDPGNTLARGYAIARDADGRIVRDAASLSVGQPLDLSFAQGGAHVQVQQTRKTRDDA